MKTYQRVVLVLIGVVLVFAGLWGGSWLIKTFPTESGYNFAAFCTACIFTILGIILIAAGTIEDAP